ncbi:MAG: phosphatidate cytidylyltransferase [Candidatus Dormibacteraceae bacterium]
MNDGLGAAGDLPAPPPRDPPAGAAGEELKPARRSRFLVRVLSGVVMGGAVLGLLFARPYGLYVVVAVAGGIALWEFRGLSDRMGSRAPSWLLYPLGAYFALSGTVLRSLSAELVLGMALVAGMVIFLFLPGRRQGLGRWSMGMAGALYIGIPFDFYLKLYGAPLGLRWVVFTLVAVVAADTAALLVGMRFGRRPFFSRISPRKTAEGALAGVLLAMVVMVPAGFFALGLAPWHGAALGILVGLAAIAGDLVESQMKRIAEVKDSSQLIPGHGGLLDRIDSMLFPGIAVYFYAYFLHLIR